MELKKCSKCGAEYPKTSEYFQKDVRIKCGYGSECKICIKLRKAKYNEANKERKSAYNKEYRERNREKLIEHYKNYRKNNQEKIKEYREANKKRAIEYAKEYRKLNRDKVISTNQKRKARKKHLPATLTAEQWGYIKKYFDNKCAYCGQEADLQQEHFVPLSKGGEYTKDNIIPACRNCNYSKYNKDFFEWYPKQKFYNKNREKAILNFLNYKNNMQQLTLF